jgi:hypothetical protein
VIRNRLFGFATASALAKAWEKKSKTWLSLAGVLVLFQFLDSRAARKPSPKKSTK